MTNEAPKRSLPLSPHPDHLRKEAKARLAGLKTRMPSVRLTDVQLILAREYGFPNWGALQTEAARRGGQGRRLRRAGINWRRIQAQEAGEHHPPFFELGLITQVSFILVALTGVGLVMVDRPLTQLIHIL